MADPLSAIPSGGAPVAGEAPFRPRGWLRNTHLQSILPSLPPRRLVTRHLARSLRGAAQSWVLDCSAGVRLQAWYTACRPALASGRTAVLLHGWEGSADSCYVLSLGAVLRSQGYHVIRLNLRDHGLTQALNRGLFHSCRLADVTGALRAIAHRCPGAPLYLAGFSLGGNFLLRAAAAPDLPASIAGVVAVSPVLDPARTLAALEQGPAIYHHYFVRRWSRSLRRKQRLWPDDYEFAPLLRTRSLRRMTDELVRAHTEFPDLAAYLDGYALVGTRLQSLSVAARILAAQDDPMIPAADLVRLANTPLLRVTLTAHGGHCGFLNSLMGRAYCDQYTLNAFEQFAEPRLGRAAQGASPASAAASVS